MRRAVVVGALVSAMGVGSLAGCANNTGNGALIGAGVGGLAGGIIGNQSGHATGGALIGAGAGALGGALIGNSMDRNEEKKERERREAEAARERAYYNDGPTYQGQRMVARTTVTKEDVVDWSRRGVKDEVIVDRIERSGQVFRLSAADENWMRDSHVSEDVIRTMRNTGR